MICSIRSWALIGLMSGFASSVNAQFRQQGIPLAGSGAIGVASQGYSVSLSADGNTAIVGGPYDNYGLGAAWVFSRSGSVWSQEAKLVGSGTSGTIHQGWSVALSGDGNTAIVGAPNDNVSAGAAWVFTRTGKVWAQQGNKLVGTGAIGLAFQGASVALSGDGNTSLVGGPTDNSSVGAAWVYSRSGGTWTQEGSKLVGSGASGFADQGSSVALSSDGNTALIGGPADGGAGLVGATWVFTRSNGGWTQQGSKLVGSGANDQSAQGYSVALSGDGNTALVEGIMDSNNVGATWVFTRSSGVWNQQGGKLVGSGAVPFPGFVPFFQGQSAALSGDGNTAILGGMVAEGARAWVFRRSAGMWTEQSNPLIGQAPTSQGQSVGLSGDGYTVLLGEPDYLGAALVFITQPSAVNLLASANPSISGQAVTFTAIVTPGASGLVTFIIDEVMQPPVALVGNRAQLTVPGFSGGTHTISAAYGGDATFIGSTSNTLMQAVNPPTLTLSTSPNPSLVAQPVTITASLAGGTGVFVGSVQFFDGVMPLGSSTVSGAQASFTTSTLIAGSHTIVAQYSFDAAAGASRIQVVSGLPSQTTLNVNLSSVLYGQAVVLTVQVGPAPPTGFPSPSGQVTFQDNGTAAGVSTLSSGTTTLSLNLLSAGTHQIVAIYGGDSFWAPSSARTVVTVTQPVLQIVNSASGLASTYAPDEAVSVFDVTVLNGDTAASVPLPTSLSGVTVNVTDSAGVTRAAQLYGSFASKGQVNLVIPSNTATGMATLSLTGQGGGSLSAMIEITPTAPGIFTATSNGQGVYSGQVVHVHSDGSQTVDSSAIYDPTQNTYVPNPVDMGLPDDQTFLILYGTGIRHRLNDDSVTATVGAQSVPVQSAAQSTYPGLDQLNLQLPRSLGGAGTVNVNITVEGQEANTVVVLIR